MTASGEPRARFTLVVFTVQKVELSHMSDKAPMSRHFRLNVKLFIIAYFTGSMCPTPRGLSVAYISILFDSLIVCPYDIAYDHYQNELRRCDYY